MRKFLFIILIVLFLTYPVYATDITAPTVPETAEKYMPPDTESFSEGLWHIVKTALFQLQPSFSEALGTCICIFAATLLLSLLGSFHGGSKHVAALAGAVTIGIVLFRSTDSLIRLGSQTVTELSEYGKLLLPVMATALASQGGVGTSTALYTATTIFSNILTTIIAKFIVPLVYAYLCICTVHSALGEPMLKNLRDFIKWAATWCLKTILYIFTGYISITGVISGSADAAAIKATKLTISGVVPVVGSILSDASETILVSAGIMKSAAGIYGLLALTAVWIGPFLQIGIQYIMLNITAGICSIFADKRLTELIKNFSSAMGLLLAMTGAICLLFLVSTICFMKGVSN